MIWNQKAETMSADERAAVQLERLQRTVRRVWEVPAYRAKLEAASVSPDSIRSLDDLRRIPLTDKEDLRRGYPFGLFAAPLSDVVRIHSSSGTTGKPTVVGYTRRDIDTWAEVMARTLACGGVTKDDVLQVAYGYGLFTGGLGVHYGAEKIGAAVIPASVGNTKRQIMMMQDFGTTAIACTPSYSLYLAETMREMGVDPATLRLRVGFLGAEPWTERLRGEIEANLGILAIDIYGLSEVIGPGVSSECEHKCGLHIFDDHFLPEIIDPRTGEPLGEGEVGELVFTTITKEALPILRYRTRDLTSLAYGTCACGRTSVRMQKILGRSDDMLIIRGINVFPSQIESVLVGIEEAQPHYQIFVKREGHLDALEVQVEVDEKLFSDEIKRLEEVRRRIAAELASVLSIQAAVKLVSPHTIQRSEGKAKRVVDLRKEGAS
ncbi:MAG: phenylacetate--CoA ligase [Planctomycetes bacterium]|nr:phenylacetate--CoA ligase [Planctomycetota bacterium]